jgi:hypothetical protein
VFGAKIRDLGRVGGSIGQIRYGGPANLILIQERLDQTAGRLLLRFAETFSVSTVLSKVKVRVKFYTAALHGDSSLPSLRASSMSAPRVTHE